MVELLIKDLTRHHQARALPLRNWDLNYDALIVGIKKAETEEPIESLYQRFTGSLTKMVDCHNAIFTTPPRTVNSSPCENND